MTWEETIEHIRTLPEYADLVEKAYFDADLQLNVSRFQKSEEFNETLRLINAHKNPVKTILDIGCGNGISAINFAKKGYEVTAVEPDASNTVGAGAIKQLKEELQLSNITVYEALAEDIDFPDSHFDMVYIRQAMHHANDLQKFVKECVRVLKPNGLLLTVRDHVIFDEKDKEWFLQEHPLQKYYGGENAYTPNQYKNAIQSAGAKIVKEYKYYDNVINYFPRSTEDVEKAKNHKITYQKKRIRNKLGVLGSLGIIWKLYVLITNFKSLDESEVPGRMYSYLAVKK